MPPHKHPVVVVTPICTPTPHLLYRCGALSICPSPTPATCQPPPLVSAPCAAFLRLPPFPASIRPPFSALVLHPGPCRPLGGLPAVVPSVSVCLRLSLLICFPVSRNLPVFGFCQVANSLRRLYLLPAPHSCVFRRFPRPFGPPFPPLSFTQVHVVPWGVCPPWFPLFLCVSDYPSLYVSLSPGIFRCLVSVRWPIFCEGERPRCLHSLAVSCPGP